MHAYMHTYPVELLLPLPMVVVGGGAFLLLPMVMVGLLVGRVWRMQ